MSTIGDALSAAIGRADRLFNVCRFWSAGTKGMTIEQMSHVLSGMVGVHIRYVEGVWSCACGWGNMGHYNALDSELRIAIANALNSYRDHVNDLRLAKWRREARETADRVTVYLRGER